MSKPSETGNTTFNGGEARIKNGPLSCAVGDTVNVALKVGVREPGTHQTIFKLWYAGIFLS